MHRIKSVSTKQIYGLANFSCKYVCMFFLNGKNWSIECIWQPFKVYPRYSVLIVRYNVYVHDNFRLVLLITLHFNAEHLCRIYHNLRVIADRFIWNCVFHESSWFNVNAFDFQFYEPIKISIVQMVEKLAYLLLWFKCQPKKNSLIIVCALNECGYVKKLRWKFYLPRSPRSPGGPCGPGKPSLPVNKEWRRKQLFNEYKFQFSDTEPQKFHRNIRKNNTKDLDFDAF